MTCLVVITVSKRLRLVGNYKTSVLVINREIDNTDKYCVSINRLYRAKQTHTQTNTSCTGKQNSL